MASTTVYPNGDGTKTGWTNESSGTSNLWDSVDEGTVTPVDANYNQVVTNDVIAYLLQDMPPDFDTATAVTIKVRLQKGVFKSWDRQFSTCALYKSDESTAITATCDLTGTTGTVTTFTFTPSITGATDKTSWDGMRLKFNTPTGSSGSLWIYAIQVEITYDVAATGNPSCIGLVVGNGTPSVPATGNIWLLRPPSAYRRFETRFGKPVCPLQASYRVRRGFDRFARPVAGQARSVKRRGEILVSSVVHPDGHGAGRCRGWGPCFRGSDTRR